MKVLLLVIIVLMQSITVIAQAFQIKNLKSRLREMEKEGKK